MMTTVVALMMMTMTPTGSKHIKTSWLFHRLGTTKKYPYPPESTGVLGGQTITVHAWKSTPDNLLLVLFDFVLINFCLLPRHVNSCILLFDPEK